MRHARVTQNITAVPSHIYIYIYINVPCTTRMGVRNGLRGCLKTIKKKTRDDNVVLQSILRAPCKIKRIYTLEITGLTRL